MINRILAILFFCLVLGHVSQSRPQIYAGGNNKFCLDEVFEATTDCKRQNEGFANVLIMDGAYCRNDGTGICSAFSGRFEYQFNTFTNQMLGPMEKTSARSYMDSDGYHKRVPVSYNPQGKIVYADRSLNWAEQFAKNSGQRVNLLNISDLNWCNYARQDLWPYKSAFKSGEYEVYFFNRQSCIFKGSQVQHYNTRFLHTSKLRIDLDMNPTIFLMQDNIANDTLLVKHHRQHWNEVKFKIIEQKQPLFFVQMEQDCTNCKINKTMRHILPGSAYKNLTNVCLDDRYFKNTGGPNAELVQSDCGMDKSEIADMPYPQRGTPLYVDLHNIPQANLNEEVGSFYQVNNDNLEDWKIYAKDGRVFTATTTIPTKKADEYRVVQLFASFRVGQPENVYDEFYPMPLLADFTAKRIVRGDNILWDTKERDSKAVKLKYLNYVDDIAYLHKCDTILVIFGPLYSEYPAENFNTSTRAALGAITALGMWEMTNAFFAVPNTSTLWAYHRTNFVARYDYTCEKPLVTAQKVGRYYRHFGRHQVANYHPERFATDETGAPYSEEYLFQVLGIYKGSLDDPEPPNPAGFVGLLSDPDRPADSSDSSWLIYLIIGAILLMVIMGALCLFMTRRWRRKRKKNLAAATTRSGLSSSPVSGSRRSGMSSSAASRSHRSGMSPSAISKSKRSDMSGVNKNHASAMGARPSAKTKATARSLLSDAKMALGASRASSSARSMSGKGRRSGRK